MKPWPKDKTKLVAFDELIGPVRATFRGAPYNGHDIGDHDKAACASPDWTFSKEGLAYHAERGRGVLDLCLMTAFQLGMEQGRRQVAADIKFAVSTLKLVTDIKLERSELKSVIELLERWTK